jgi:tripartite-type tricarboxylate transporter receptor subunit TctC
VVVDNRPGASAIIGLEAIARATPDGYTLGFLVNSFHTNPSLYLKLPYDSYKDFQPVIYQGSTIYLLTVTPSLPIHSVKELIAYAKANPGKLSYSSAGAGGSETLTMELLKIRAGADIVAVTYKGGQQIFTDAFAGRIQIVSGNIASTLPHVRTGRLRGLGVTSLQRSPAVPELPTLDEAGIPGYDARISNGYAVPTGTPRDIVLRLNKEIAKTFQSPTVIEKFAANGQTLVGSTPEQYAEHIRAEIAGWAKVIKASGIQPQ